MKIKSKIIGMSYTGTRYSVVIEDTTDKKIKLPIVISNDVATEITLIKSGVGSDSLVEKVIHASELEVDEIFFKDIEEGLFKVKVKLTNGNSFSCSAPEALILAYSTNCDIYVSEDIMKTSGIKLNDDNTVDYSEISYEDNEGEQELTPIEELEKQLDKAVADEDYELAAELRDKIDNYNN